MEKFTYHSGWEFGRTLLLIIDRRYFKSKAEEKRYRKDLEARLADAINKQIESNTKPAAYYIMGDEKVVATATMYDNATLIAEALAKHSPYYAEIDVMSADGLLAHYMCDECDNDRTNHV